MTTIATNVRKRGADMTQALLYAAFALLVLIGVLAMYSVVTTSNNKTTSARTISTAAQEARTLFRNSAEFTGLTDTVLIQAGSIPSDAIGGTAGDEIVLPYGSSVEFLPAAGDPTKFQATLRTSDTRGGNALCTFLTSGDAGVITGPLGAEYTVRTTAGEAVDCSGEDGAVIVYER